ncbi:MAG TPA: DUF2164 domain-containing protein [Longimicrobiales bacterium]
MVRRQSDSIPRIELTDERRARLLGTIRSQAEEIFDEPVSDFRAQALLDLFLREIGPSVYNQGVRDASAFMQEKLTDLEAEVYEPER